MKNIKIICNIVIYFMSSYSYVAFSSCEPILFNAEPFGFGPSAAIEQLTNKLQKTCKQIGYIGEGFTLDIQNEINYQDTIIIPRNATNVEIRRALKELRKKYDYFFTALDFNYARIAKEEGYIVAVYDMLSWFWQDLDEKVENIDLYIAQNFIGVEERLKHLDTPNMNTQIIPSITPFITYKQPKKYKQLKYIFINFGGLSNPFIENNLFSSFIYTIGNIFEKSLNNKSNNIQITTSKNLLHNIPKALNPRTLKTYEVQQKIQNSHINLMTSGLGNLFEASSANVPVIWLPPMNNSQGQQIKLLEKQGLIDWSIDWSDFTDEPPIDYFQSQPVVMEAIKKSIESFISTPIYQKSFKILLDKKLQIAEEFSLQNNPLNISGIVKQFGNNGIDDLASIVLQWAEPNKNTIKKLKNPPKFSATWDMGGDLTIRFTSDEAFDWTEKNNIEFAAHLPGFKPTIDKNPAIDFTITHHFIDSETIAFKQDENNLHIFSSWKEKLPADFLHLLYGICRKLWLEKNIYPVHGALLTKDNHGYPLLVGPPGSGKTTLSLHLTQNKGYKIFSGDKTLIKIDEQGKMTAISGTDTLTVRKKNNHELNSLTTETLYDNDERLLFKLDKQYLSEDSESPVSAIHLIDLNQGVTYQEALNKPSALHTLYPFFMDKQREDILIGEDKEILDGNVDITIRKQLAKRLKKALTWITVYKTIGPVEDLALAIQQNKASPPTVLRNTQKKKILMGICGMGNGHLNRQLPLVNYLLKAEHEVIIFTYGKAINKLQKLANHHINLKIIEVANPYIVGTVQGLDFTQTASHPANAGVNFFAINTLAMQKVSDCFGTPDMTISDYEAISAQYAYAKGCPLITINQQSKFLVGDFPEQLNGTTCLDEIERLSMFFPAAKQRIAMSFFNIDKKSDKNSKEVTVLPPILRTKIIKEKNHPLTVEPSLLIYISSQHKSYFSVEDWADIIVKSVPKNFKIHFFVPSPQHLPKNNDTLSFYRYGDPSFYKILFSCHGIISTAGHSLLSEAMYLEKPVYAIPLPLYEQQLNAHIISSGKFGITSTTLNQHTLKTFIENIDFYKENIKQDKQFLLKTGNSYPLIDIINKSLGTTLKTSIFTNL